MECKFSNYMLHIDMQGLHKTLYTLRAKGHQFLPIRHSQTEKSSSGMLSFDFQPYPLCELMAKE